MTENVLYFPYITVPQSAWFTRVLLYWDKVGAIIPSEYIDKPEALGEHTRSHIQHGLVSQVFPKDYINAIPEFVSSFERFLDSCVTDLDQRRHMFRGQHTLRIHMEKMGGIEHLLRDHGLAEVDGYPWFNVEANTANEFMVYLAGCLSQLDEIQSVPMTDVQSNLDVLVKAQVNTGPVDEERDTLRMEVLKRVFPAPEHPLTAEQIDDFKSRHRDKLRSFRRAVEREILAIAELQDASRREERLGLFEDEVQEQVEEIRRALMQRGYGEIVLGKICPVIATVPGVSSIFGLPSAIYGALPNKARVTTPSPLAYAAYAQVELHI